MGKRTISILGAGWLGLELGRVLAKEGYQVLGSTRNPSKFHQIREAGMEPYLLEISKDGITAEELQAFFSSDILVINIPPGRRNPRVEENYLPVIGHVLSAALEYGVSNILFVSSTSVYGSMSGTLNESDQPVPDTSSGKALLASETTLLSGPIPATIIRSAGQVGGDRHPGRFLAGRTGLSRSGAPVNLIHRDDLVEIIRQVIRQECWNNTFNAVADEHPSRKAFYTLQGKRLGLSPPLFKEEDGLNEKCVQNDKVKRELGIRFKYPDPMQF